MISLPVAAARNLCNTTAHLAWADLEIEAKGKNLASTEFAAGLGLGEVWPRPAAPYP